MWARRGGIAAAIVGLLLVAGGLGIYSHQQTEFAKQQAESAKQQAELRDQADAAKEEAVRQAHAAEIEKQRADAQRDQALRTQSLFLADLSAQETRRGNATNGMLLALEGLPKEMAKPDRPYVVEASGFVSCGGRSTASCTCWKVTESTVDWSAAFSPDGTRVVTASVDQTARLWDAATGKALVTLEWSTLFRSYSAAFSPDGTRVVTASSDNTARLWDAATGKALVTLEGHTDRVISAAFSPDGTRVVTASDDHTAQIWRVFPTTQALIDYARSIVPRQLTPAQRKQFFLEAE